MSITLLLEELRSALETLQSHAQHTTELVDQCIDVSAGLTLEEYADLSVLLRDVRDAVSTAKTRCTALRDRVNQHFVVAITDAGDTQYRTGYHLFLASADGFFAPPSPKTKPNEFSELYDWLREHGHNPNAVLFSDRGLKPICMDLLKEGKPLPPHVKNYTVASVTIRRNSTSQ